MRVSELKELLKAVPDEAFCSFGWAFDPEVITRLEENWPTIETKPAGRFNPGVGMRIVSIGDGFTAVHLKDDELK